MYVSSPYESLVQRLIVSAARGKLQEWSPRIFASDAVLHVTNTAGAVLDVPRARVEEYFGDSGSLWCGRDVEVTLIDGGATISPRSDLLGQSQELFLHFKMGKIDEMWSYPAAAPPPEVMAARRTSDAAPPVMSCCGPTVAPAPREE